MRQITHTITVDRLIDDVFAFFTSLESISLWQRGVVRSELRSPAPLQSGSQVVEIRRFFGREVAAPWQVTAYDPPRVRGFRMDSGPLRGAGAMTFSETPQGTHGLLRFVEPLLGRVITWQTVRDFATAKRILEAERWRADEPRSQHASVAQSFHDGVSGGEQHK